ncbi:MAG: type II toxin-antitoxin system VapC family toxin [Polyangiales bacterium]
MLIPDLNLLIYAYNADAPHHEAARAWWEACLSGQEEVGLPWAVLHGFMRLMTHRRVLEQPLRPDDVIAIESSWLERDNAFILQPGDRHFRIWSELLSALGIAGKLTTDSHLAALAIEHRAELHSNDGDFARFRELRWHNPLRAAKRD